MISDAGGLFSARATHNLEAQGKSRAFLYFKSFRVQPYFLMFNKSPDLFLQ